MIHEKTDTIGRNDKGQCEYELQWMGAVLLLLSALCTQRELHAEPRWYSLGEFGNREFMRRPKEHALG